MFFDPVEAVHQSLIASIWSLPAFTLVSHWFSSNSRHFGKQTVCIRWPSKIPTQSGSIEFMLEPTNSVIRLFPDGPLG